jgi:hypothetical protein
MQEMLEEPLDLSMIPPSQVDQNWHPKALFPVRDEVEDDPSVLPVLVQRLPTGKRRRLNVQSAGISFNREAEDDRVFPVVQRLPTGKRRRLNEEPMRVLHVVEEELDAFLVEYEESFDSSEVVEDILQNVVEGGSVESSSADTSSASVEETADQEIPAQSYGSGFWIDDQGRPRRFSCRLLGEQ